MIPADFGLRPTPQERSPLAPAVPRSLRTEWNVRDSDATLVIAPDPDSVDDPGTAFARETARRLERPLLIVAPCFEEATEQVVEWLCEHRVVALGVGGPSERTVPGIGLLAHALLSTVYRRVRSG